MSLFFTGIKRLNLLHKRADEYLNLELEKVLVSQRNKIIGNWESKKLP